MDKGKEDATYREPPHGKPLSQSQFRDGKAGTKRQVLAPRHSSTTFSPLGELIRLIWT